MTSKGKDGKTKRWTILKDSLGRTFTAFIESTQLSVSVPGSPVSPTTNLERVVDSLQSKGSTHIDGERIQFHEHATDHLKEALDELEEKIPGSRIVVFVDDLDRCTPEKALEVVESIKAFFDIRGIVYVIGMDSESLNHIVKQKYGNNPEISGTDYLEKIVQLPFQIPVWKPRDIFESISKIISKGLEDPNLVEEFLKNNRKTLIVKAIEPNPRQIKRFVNNIILAKAVFGKGIDIDKLIAVQALNFRSEWNRFLELITPNSKRSTFFNSYYIPLKQQGKDISRENLIEQGVNARQRLSEEVGNIFQELENQKNHDLEDFLDAGADKILADIKRMEEYRRALVAPKVSKEEEQVTGKQSPTNDSLLELLKMGKVEEFNDIRREYHIIPNLSHADLSNVELSYANLSHANLSHTNLSRADFLDTRLARAKLPYANLSHAASRC